MKLSKLKKYVFQHYKVWDTKLIEKDATKLPRKRNVSDRYKEGEAPVKFVSKVEEYYPKFFLSSNWYGC